MKRETKDAIASGFFWLIYAILFGLVIIKMVKYVNG